MTAGFVDTSSPLRHSAPSVFLIQVACCKMSDFDEFEKQLSENRQGECAVLALLLLRFTPQMDWRWWAVTVPPRVRRRFYE